jgi:hypothetical protein
MVPLQVSQEEERESARLLLQQHRLPQPRRSRAHVRLRPAAPDPLIYSGGLGTPTKKGTN